MPTGSTDTASRPSTGDAAMPAGSDHAGVDLHLDLAAEGGRRAAIEDALRRAIRDGQLVVGTPLPSTRALARDLGVARGTVTEAYDQLVAEGWLAARPGSGTAVAWTGEQDAPAGRPGGTTPIGTAEPRHDLRPGAPDVSIFPRQEWSVALRKALRTAPDAMFQYTDARGLPEIRDALAGYLARSRGVRTDGERIIICSGFVQALALLTSVFVQRGMAAVALENPCIGSYRRVPARLGLAVRSVPVDDDGADPSGLARHRDVGAVFVTPAHQYPTGCTMAPARRAALTEWARATGGFVVEDDYDGEFRYDRQPIGAVQGMDPDHVVYVGTASKSLAPGLRLAWMAVPGELLADVVEAKELADRQPAVLEQLALGEMVATGGLDRHIRRSRLRYRRRRDELVSALAAVPAVQPKGIAAGLHAVLHLPDDGPPEGEVVSGLAAAGVAVHGIGGYWHEGGRHDQGLVVGFGTPPAHAFPAAVAALTATLAELYG